MDQLLQWVCQSLKHQLGVRTQPDRCHMRVKQQSGSDKFIVEHVFRSVYIGSSAVQTSTIPYSVRCLECERRLRDAHWPVLFAVDLEIARCGEHHRVVLYSGAQCRECCKQVPRIKRASTPFLLLQRWVAEKGAAGEIDVIGEQWGAYAKELVAQRTCRMCCTRVSRKKCKWHAVVHVAPDAQTVVTFPVLYCCNECKRGFEWMESMNGEHWYSEEEEALFQRTVQKWWSFRRDEDKDKGAWSQLVPWYRFLLPSSARYNVSLCTDGR